MKIAAVIAFRDFRDEEYFVPKKVLEEKAGAEVSTFSDSLGKAVGKYGGEAEVTGLVDNLDPDDYDAVFFAGGPGAHKHIKDEAFHRVAQQTLQKNKILAAICVAPAILAEAGVLSEKKATVWSSPMDKSAIKILEKGGAVFQPDPVVVDDKIITAAGPEYAKRFAEAIINVLIRPDSNL